jgi:fumarate hydratase class I
MQAYICIFHKYVCVYEGTAMISGKRGQFVLIDGSDEEHLSEGVYDTFTKTNLRY